MNKEELYQQIQAFNSQLTNPSDRSSKTYEKAYLYVDDKNAEDKAEFVGYLMDQGYMKNEYPTVVDLAFGSGNLTSHIIFDNDIRYDSLLLNDINTEHTHQGIVDYIDKSDITYEDILDSEVFKDDFGDLVIVNPQIGGNYIDGDILNQKEEDESQQDVLDKLGDTLNHFIDNGAIVLFYGEEKYLKLILPNHKYIKYNSKMKDIFVLSNAITESLCFEKSGKDFVECTDTTQDDENIESFDDIEIIAYNDKEDTNEEEKFMKADKKERFVSEEVNYNFPHKNILLKGVPGTGKSQTIENIIENDLNLKDRQSNICRINIHSASSNADLMQGIGIESNDGKIEYQEKQGLIFNHIKKALFAPNQPFVLVLEEIQENSLNELIGDLIYLIEEKKRVTVDADKFENGKEYEYQAFIEEVLKDENNKHYIEIPYLVDTSTAYRKMVLPTNLYIFCTSNYRDDKKVIEDNLLRRFDVVEIYPQTQEQLGEDVFKSKDISDFLAHLNEEILKKFEDEVHPDRYLIGHANWLDITEDDNDENKKQFYTALLKVLIEFKEIREVDFDAYAKDIIKGVCTDNNLSDRLKEYIEACDFKYESYKEMVEKLQKEIYSFLK